MGCDKLRLSLLRDMYPESIFIVSGCVCVCVRLVDCGVVVFGSVVVWVVFKLVCCVTVCVDRGVCERIFRRCAVCLFLLSGGACGFWAGGEAAEE